MKIENMVLGDLIVIIVFLFLVPVLGWWSLLPIVTACVCILATGWIEYKIEKLDDKGVSK